MHQSENPCLSLAIDPLSRTTTGAERFAIWVLKAPFPNGQVLNECVWPETLTQSWRAWQEMFSTRELPDVPQIHQASLPPLAPKSVNTSPSANGQVLPYTAMLMQDLGISLWKWLFDGAIKRSLDQSEGFARGQKKQLRLRLEIRDPDLIAVPWEIMQPETGKPAISRSQQILFSRTTSNVDPLPPQRLEQSLNILLILGDPDPNQNNGGHKTASALQLEQEAKALAKILECCKNDSQEGENSSRTVLCQVDTLLQPTKAELISRLENEKYNILFYAGHGERAPDGGLLFLRSDARINGTELAQVLVRCHVKLAVFNACWGAQPERYNQHSLPRSSLAEVLIHHGVPAVLGMREPIADEEALSFIQAFAQALAAQNSIDEAVAVARQKLLTLYKFNQPAWTLPVLYMHPQFDGELIRPIEENPTQFPVDSLPTPESTTQSAYLRLIGGLSKVEQIEGGHMRVGRHRENDLVIEKQEVSRKHAEIFCRDSLGGGKPTYFLSDDSTFGTFILGPNGWQKVFHQEVPLQSGTQLKFGSIQGQTWEFIIQDNIE
ncbi:CHAT domain-containing protein [Trichocoleus sp. FACHB-90]|uniref:CHAT domain-containing protein n=1 Tax=Cyanophyceae TaxID=3028117 RepID=UPI001688C0C5|nr:CHAT domain-containing protein [Trichocoleus sp. FACHB-90]MBD1929751.1 CHAT domain-containing protein [Trichocoleus sp. FACHB-90]